jgi:hypothetical protein
MLSRSVQAEQYLRDAVAAVPEYGPAHYQYALTLNKLGRKRQSPITIWQKWQ